MSANLEKRLVTIKGDIIGSGILLSNLGLVISCHHNFFSTEGKRAIKTISLRNEGTIKDIPYSKNIKFCIRDDNESLTYKEAKLSDVWLVRLNIDPKAYNIHTLSNIQATQDIKEEEEVTIIAFDDTFDKPFEKKSGKISRIEALTKDHPTRFHINLDGYPGYSGGGVFNSKRQLIGIINCIQQERNNRIIASLIPTFIVRLINEEFNNQYQQHQIDQVCNFFKAIEKQFSRTKLFHSNKLIKLSDQYIPVRLTSQKKERNATEKSPSHLQIGPETLRFTKNKSEEIGNEQNIKDNVSWEEVRSLDQKLMILADPGMGKSTLLQRETLFIAHQQLHNLKDKKFNLDEVIFPIFIRLKQLSDYDLRAISVTNITNILIEILLTEYEEDIIQPIIELLKTALKTGRCSFLLDGLDEVPKEKRGDLSKKLNTFFRNYPSKVVCSSRIVGYSNFIDSAKELEILPFSEQATILYVKSWFHNAYEEITNGTTAEKMLEELKRKPQIQALTRIPLLLSLLCSLYQYGQLTLPAKKSQVYKQAVDSILSKWVLQRDPNINWEVKPIKDLLKYIAYEMSCSHKQIITKDELFDLVKRCLYPTQSSYLLDLEKEAVIKTKLTEITEKYGVIQNLHKDSEDYEFLHRSFQEYFTACYIEEKLQNNKNEAEEIIKAHLWNYDWHETLSLLAGITQEPHVLINLVREEKDDIFSSMLLLASQCISECNNLADPTTKQLIDKLYQVWCDRKFRYISLVQQSIISVGQTNAYMQNLLINALSFQNSYLKNAVIEVLGKVAHKSATTPLTSLLSNEDSAVRSAAAEALGKIGDINAVTALIAGLSDQDWSVRKIIIKALGNIGHKSATTTLISLLSDKELSIKKDATEALSKIADQQATKALITTLYSENNTPAISNLLNNIEVPILIDSLSDENTNIRNTIAQILQKIANKNAIPYLIAVLSDKRDFVRRISAYTLGNIASSSTTVNLIPLLSDEVWQVRWAAVYALGQIGDKRAISPLINVLSSNNLLIKSAVAEALGKIGDESATTALVPFLSAKEPALRSVAAEALGKIGDINAIEDLIHLSLYDEDWFVRKITVTSLSKFPISLTITTLKEISLCDPDEYVKKVAIESLGKSKNETTVEILTNISLSNQEPSIRNSAIYTLTNMKSADMSKTLITALSDKNSTIRGSAADALSNTTNKEALRPLIAALSDPDWYVSNAAVNSLSKIAINDINLLIEALVDQKQNETARRNITRVLGNIADEQVIPALTSLLSDKDPKVKIIALNVLGNLATENLVGKIANGLSDQDYGVKKTTIKALGKIGGNDAIPYLTGVLSDNDPNIRKTTVEALGITRCCEVIPHLISALSDQDSSVKESAVEALHRIATPNTLRDIIENPAIDKSDPSIFLLMRNLFIKLSKDNKKDFNPIYLE